MRRERGEKRTNKDERSGEKQVRRKVQGPDAWKLDANDEDRCEEGKEEGDAGREKDQRKKKKRKNSERTNMLNPALMESPK